MTIQRVSAAFSIYISNLKMFVDRDGDALLNCLREGEKRVVLRLKLYRYVIVVKLLN